MSETEAKISRDYLMVAVRGSTAFIYVSGRGNFKMGPDLRDFGSHSLAHGVTRFMFDMSECAGMDSTFMGILAGLAIKAKKVGGELIVINMSQCTYGLLSLLGLERLIQTYMAENTPLEWTKIFGEGLKLAAMETKEASQAETAQTMLEAHQTLVAVCPENLPKFEDLITFLKQDMSGKKNLQ